MFVRSAGIVLLVVFGAFLLCAQAPELDATTPEGELLTKVGLSEDRSEKLELLGKFAKQFPGHSAVGWVFAQEAQLHQEAENHAEVLASAEKLYALDASAAGPVNRLRASAMAVKSAETLEQPDDIIRWAKASFRAASDVQARPKPDDEDEAAAWESENQYAATVAKYADYVYISLAGKSTDAAEIALYAEALRVQDSASEYLLPIIERQFMVGRATDSREHAVAAAELLTEMDKGNEDTLLYLASIYLETKKNQDQIIPYTTKALELLETKERPEEVSEEEFAKQQTLSKGLAHWIQGIHHATRNSWANTNRSLRTALPLVKDNPTMTAAAYFYLGVANFEIGKKSKDHKEIIDAVKFTEICTKMSSPYQAQARQNLAAIQSQFRMR
jgi:hypothetical protein